MAMALRAGVTLADLEFAQFHPTVLNIPGVPPFLISEAVRGEGAWLINSAGERFMTAIDDRAELAPRNVVAGEIHRQLNDVEGNAVYLDLRHLDPALIAERFPTITQHLADVGLDLASDPIPVAPAAHYFMGGIVADTRGETSLAGLLAIGETACTGVHGANRLASNSLLEGLVFGINAADRLADTGFPVPGDIVQGDRVGTTVQDAAGAMASIREIMSADVGVMRSRDGLQSAIGNLTAIEAPGAPTDRAALIARNMREVAIQVASSALAREESRGGHIRTDFPDVDPTLDTQHQMLRACEDQIERWYGPLSTSPDP